MNIKQESIMNNKQETIMKLKKYRWLVYGVVAVIFFLVHFHRLSIGVIRDELVLAFGVSATTYANLGAMYFYAYLLMQIPTGILADTIGARKIVTAGTIVAGTGTILFGAAPNLALAFLGRLLIGLGVSVVYICLLKLQTEWFEESKFGSMTGLTVFVGNAGGVVAQAPLASMIAYFTWRPTFIGVGLISLVLAVLCFIYVRNTPQDIGLPSLAEIAGKRRSPSQPQKKDFKEGLIKVIKNYRTMLAFIIIMCYAGTFYALCGTWGVEFLSAVYGLNKIEASRYTSLFVLGAAIGSILIGVFSDTIKSRKIPLLSFGLLVNVFWFVMLYYNKGQLNSGMLMILLFMLGAFYMCYSVLWALGKESNDPRYAGIAISVVNLGSFMGGGIVPVLIGSVLDRYQGILSGIMLYRKAFIIILIANLIAFALSVFVTDTKCVNIYEIAEKTGE